jgi:ABC-type Mn2+/Zn2+ transport system ATPase subunit
MLVGCLVRHFKVYENVVFTPITLGIDGNLAVFTGNNGVGKSSILEAINHFFHQSKWIVNSNAKKSEAYIAPLFLIKKDDFESPISKELLDAVSNYFWNVSESANATISKNDSIKALLIYRDKLKIHYDSESYYLFLVGLKHPNEAPSFVTFDSDLRENIAQNDLESDDLNKLYKSVCDHYSYVYIPVESATQNILKLESFELQELMDRDVLDEIDGILNNRISVPRESLGLDRGPLNVGFSPLKHINDSLDKFIAEANKSIQEIGSSYAFSTERNQKRNLSVQDIRDRILDEYFSVRVLRKDGKLIEDLSSGEQRIALFDIAYSLLSQGKKTKKNLILAIDEPESSMHMSQCYRQFLRISEISSKYGHQVLMTSHWYGFLPVIEFGYINHIENKSQLKISQHALRTITSEQKVLPDDISLKSMFDLVSSVIGMMRSDTANWLVCEGMDDQIYLKGFLGDRVKNLSLLPMGGIDNVVKLYNYLYTPLSEKNEKKEISGKVVCLTDTDSRPVYPHNHKSIKDGVLTIRRMDLREEKFTLVELNPNSERHITVIEDLLDAKIFYEACRRVVNEFGDEGLNELFSNIKVSDGVVYTGFSKNLESMEGKDISSHKRKGELVEFLSKHEIKYKLASYYMSIFKESGNDGPQWINGIVELFEAKAANRVAEGF